MTAKSKTKAGAKPQKKLAFRKDAVRDLSVESKGRDLRGGGNVYGNTATERCFGTLV